MNTATDFDPDFDHVFTVTDDLQVIDAPNVYAPDVWHDDTEDVVIDGDGWEPLSGYTGQYGYSGAVMHASELFGGRLRRDVLSTPGTYVLCTVDVLDEEDAEPAGWAVLRRTEP